MLNRDVALVCKGFYFDPSANYGLIDLNSTINKDSTGSQNSTFTVQELLRKVN